MKAIDQCFSTQTYLDVHFRRREREAYARERAKLLRARASPEAPEAAASLLARVQTYFKNMKEDLDADAVSSPAGCNHPWVLLQAGATPVDAGTDAQALDADLCLKCIRHLSKRPDSRKPDDPKEPYQHHMPPGARADGWWGGPMPAELKRLSAVYARIILLAYVSQTILRVKLSPADFARACAASRKHLIPEFVTGNALAVPLYVESLPTLVGALPDELSQHLQVHYTGDHSWLRHAPELLVSIPDLRAAFSWLLSHNWYWLETTFDDLESTDHTLSPQLEALLAAYQKDLGGEESGVPQTFIDSATDLKSAEATEALPGPVDAACDAQDPQSVEASAAIIDTSMSESVALRQVQRLMEVHDDLLVHEEAAASASNESERMTCLQLQLDDIGNARRALAKLSGSKIEDELKAYLAHAEDTQSICRVSIASGQTLLKSNAESFWQRCYVEIFPRGDCGENDRNTRAHRLSDRQYSGHMLEMMDKPWFREHKEFTASFYYFLVRRDQMSKVGLRIRSNEAFR